MILISTIISAFSQSFLKKAASKKYKNKIHEYLNGLVISSYCLFFTTTVINVIALKWLDLSLAIILESFGQIFVPILGSIMLGENMGYKKIVGIMVIIGGTVIVFI